MSARKVTSGLRLAPGRVRAGRLSTTVGRQLEVPVVEGNWVVSGSWPAPAMEVLAAMASALATSEED